MFIWSNEAHIQNAQAYFKQPNTEKNCIWASENEILEAANLFHWECSHLLILQSQLQVFPMGI